MCIPHLVHAGQRHHDTTQIHTYARACVNIRLLHVAQGTTALWRPRWIEFPELIVRADVVVRGPKVDAALDHFAALLENDLAELVEVIGREEGEREGRGAREGGEGTRGGAGRRGRGGR